jgi:aspartyl-tRNA(Asn)/glutamyl-tRNA(Gln) amidotransferase subunit A
MDGIWITELGSGPPGRRLAVKDLFDTAGVRTTYGSAVFTDYVPSATAAAVALLETDGWVNVGKSNLHEFAYGVTSQNLHYGVVPNPAAPGRTAGGSSGGSAAALVAGLADAALGTDTGGSIRIPAACCGVVGFKPSFGLVPVDGAFPLAPSFDHVGPIALDVAGCVALMGSLAPGVEVSELGAARVAFAWAEHCAPLVQARVREAAQLLSATAVSFPTAQAVGPAFMREVGDVHQDLYAECPELYGDNIREKIERCIAVDEAEYAAATAARQRLGAEAEEALAGFDLLLTPTLAFVAPASDVVETEVRADFVRFTFPFNALGWPALALPAGPVEDGLQASVQIAGRPGSDGLVLSAGLALEAALKP